MSDLFKSVFAAWIPLFCLHEISKNLAPLGRTSTIFGQIWLDHDLVPKIFWGIHIYGSRCLSIFIGYIHILVSEMIFLCVNSQFWPVQSLCYWIGVKENFNRNPPYFMVKTIVSCRFSLKPMINMVFKTTLYGFYDSWLNQYPMIIQYPMIMLVEPTFWRYTKCGLSWKTGQAVHWARWFVKGRPLRHPVPKWELPGAKRRDCPDSRWFLVGDLEDLDYFSIYWE